MAIGDASVTKGHVPQLQPSSKLHKPSLEPEPTRTKEEESDTEDEPLITLLFARELEEALGFNIMGCNNDWAVYVEVHTVQAERCLHYYGLLSLHGQRCS